MHMLRYYSILAVVAYEVVACEVAVVHSSGVVHTLAVDHTLVVEPTHGLRQR